MCGGLLRMQVLAYDPYLSAEEIKKRGATKVELDELLRRADFVSINCPLTDETRGMIGARAIRSDAAARLFHHRGARLHPRRGRRSRRRCATRRSPAPASMCGARSRRRPNIR